MIMMGMSRVCLMLCEDTADRETVHERHKNIQQDGIRDLGRHYFQGSLAIAGTDHLVPQVLELLWMVGLNGSSSTMRILERYARDRHVVTSGGSDGPRLPLSRRGNDVSRIDDSPSQGWS